MMHESFYTYGYCTRCQKNHGLKQGKSLSIALNLMEILEREQCLDFEKSSELRDPQFSLDYLWGKAKGQMFGIAHCLDKCGNEVILKAFSCQYGGHWVVDGWVEPLFNVADYWAIMNPADQIIKGINIQLTCSEFTASNLVELKKQRKKLSQKIMKQLHAIYEIRNFRGEQKTIFQTFLKKGIPTGAGDCCAPKLINAAIIRGLIPTGITEFYWGAENQLRNRSHRHIYSSCVEKCQPLLGFMLCGLENQNEN